MDFLGIGSNNHQAIRTSFETICSIECPEDGVQFDGSTMQIENICDEQEYGGIRVKLPTKLGQAQFPLQLDISFGDAVTPGPEEKEYPTILDHPAPLLKTYPKETFIAEKFEAMIRLGPSNSRMKDFWDVAALAQNFLFDGKLLSEAIKATFDRRGTPFTEETPEALRPSFYQDKKRGKLWRAFLQRVEPGIPVSNSFTLVGELIISFLLPIWESLVNTKTFDVRWSQDGMWKSIGTVP